MAKKIKRRVLSAVFQKRALLILPLVMLGVVIPLAFVDGLAATIAAHTASALAGVFLLTISTVSLVFSTFTDWFLRISLSPEFIGIPYTTGNQFVMYGWGVVRDFVNMFFIIILIIIGLSTALQIETYRWQKTLPRLVAVALLINFTPVVLGVFIDATNIMMNYFVSSLAEESVFVMRMRALFDIMASNLADAPWTSFTGAIITPVAMTVIFTIFNTLTGIVYALYGGIFALRYVVIWLLVIISPFGFFCYILPGTQPFFKKWWKLFIWWCIAGVSAAFFLYMGEIMFQFIDHTGLIPPSTEHQGMEIGMFIQVFPLMIPLFFILFGFFATLSISSSGAVGVIEGFQSASGAAKKTSARLPGSTFKEKTQAASASVRSAFSPGPAASVPSTPSGEAPSGEGEKKSSRRGFLRRESVGRERKMGEETPRSVGQVASFASGGSESATKDIAENIAKMSESVDKEGKIQPSAGVKAADPERKKEETQCKGCGATVGKDTSLCPLCRKNILQEKRSE